VACNTGFENRRFVSFLISRGAGNHDASGPSIILAHDARPRCWAEAIRLD
jgi:hypothetical protein